MSMADYLPRRPNLQLGQNQCELTTFDRGKEEA